MDEQAIPLSELLHYITAELRRVHEAAADPVMKFQECELEFAIEAETKQGAGLNIWVLKLGGGVKRSEKNTIKIKYVALEDSTIVAPVQAPEGTLAKPARQGKAGKKGPPRTGQEKAGGNK